jgi:hypothetical protein
VVVVEGEMNGLYWSDSSLGLSDKSLHKPEETKKPIDEERPDAEFSVDSEIKWTLYPLDDSDSAVRNRRESFKGAIDKKKSVVTKPTPSEQNGDECIEEEKVPHDDNQGDNLSIDSSIERYIEE